MFKMKVTEEEIRNVMELIPVYPNRIVRRGFLYNLVLDECGGWDYSPVILDRKVRLCIAELRRRRHPIISLKKGYALMGDDPEPAVHFINGLYSRAHKLTQQADIMYGLVKQKYGDEVAQKVEQSPGQPALDGVIK